MNELEVLGEIRELIGNPTPTEVSHRQLRAHLLPALEWLASELRWNVRQDDTGLGLVAGQQEYTIPDEVIWLMFVAWNNLRLDQRSVFHWDREGTKWRGNANVDILTEYAIHGRVLILLAPPSAAAITTDPVLHYRAIIGPPQITQAGIVGMAETEQYLAALRAAVRYTRSHPTEENAARTEAYVQEMAELLPQAKRRAMQNMGETYLPSLLPYTERTGGAR